MTPTVQGSSNTSEVNNDFDRLVEVLDLSVPQQPSFGDERESKTVRRFPSLSDSTFGTRHSSSTLVSKEAESQHQSEDEEDAPELSTAPIAVGFFDSSLSKTRRSVFRKYSWTRMSALNCIV